MRTILLLLTLSSLLLLPIHAQAQPAPPVPSTTRGTCDVRPRTAQDCQARALAFCGPGGTSSFFVCRAVFQKFCTTPERVTSVASCLAARCDTLPPSPGHSYEYTRVACRKGRFGRPDMENLCKEQTCDCKCPVPPPCPAGQKRLEVADPLVGCNCPSNQCIPDPDWRGTCDVRPRTKTSCLERSVVFCGEAGTSSFVLCRQVFQKWCETPVRVANVEQCLQERCDTLPAAPGHTKAHAVAACRRGRFNRDDMSKLCAEQACPDCKCPALRECPFGQRIVTPTNLQGCACPRCEQCPEPAPAACPAGLTKVKVPGPGPDKCPVYKCQDCNGFPAPVCPAPSISRETSRDAATGCPVHSCVSCNDKCPSFKCPEDQRAIRLPGQCCASQCEACPSTLASCPKLQCKPGENVIFPQSHCCPVCSTEKPGEDDRIASGGSSSAPNPLIGAAIVGGCLVTGGAVAAFLILKGFY